MPTAVSLFSGAGGFCEGVRLAGFKVVCAVEMDGYAARTHSANFPKVPMFRGDVKRFLVDAQPGVPSKRELIDGGVDLVYGGPPCQGFSQIGPRDLKDPRNLLYLEFARVLKALKPKAFIMENVPCQSAFKFDPVSASNFDPFARRGLAVALASSELAGIAETWRARVA